MGLFGLLRALVSRWLLACVLGASVVLSGCGLLSKPGGAHSSATANFELEITAQPEQAQALLAEHLELNRYQYLEGLRRQELTRLLSVADGDIRKLLATLGYFSPVIELELERAPAGSAQLDKVRIQVDGGQQAQVAAVQVDVSSPQTDQAVGNWQRQSVLRNWSLEVGQPFTQEAWANAKMEGLRALQARRYPTAELTSSRADIDADTHQAQLQAHYNTGALYHFGPLVIEGAQRYNPAGVIRQARLPVGAEYRQSTLLDVQQRIAATGLYDSVFLNLMTDAAPEGAVEASVPVLAQVRETPLQKWVYGLGMSTDTGARFSLDYTHNRVPGLGWQAQSKLQLDKKNPLLSTRLYSLPDHTGWNWFTTAEAQRSDLADYATNSMALSAGRSKNEDAVDHHYFVRYDLASPQGEHAPPTSSAISANYGWTGRNFNNPSNPSRGFGLAAEVGVGTVLTPQRTPFTRALLRWQYFQPIGSRDAATQRRSRLAWRAQTGAVLARKNADIPLTLLFLSGGDTTVRGYSYQSIGTRSRSGQLIGGRYLLSGSMEWQRPMVLAGNRKDWEHTVFVDAGTVTDSLGAGRQFFVGAGSGIRWNSPVGPLQADLAYGFKTQKIRLHLRLGFNF